MVNVSNSEKEGGGGLLYGLGSGERLELDRTGQGTVVMAHVFPLRGNACQ